MEIKKCYVCGKTPKLHLNRICTGSVECYCKTEKCKNNYKSLAVTGRDAIAYWNNEMSSKRKKKKKKKVKVW